MLIAPVPQHTDAFGESFTESSTRAIVSRVWTGKGGSLCVYLEVGDLSLIFFRAVLIEVIYPFKHRDVGWYSRLSARSI